MAKPYRLGAGLTSGRLDYGEMDAILIPKRRLD